MIRFFRKVRLEYISGKRVGKYLLYAFGEIVLVVIGILIALGINNANQKRILQEKESVYLHGLYSEFTTSRKKLEELIRVNNENVEGARQLANFVQAPEEAGSEEAFSELLFKTFAYDIAYNPNNSLLMEMISSGSLKDLTDDSLRFRLTTWVATMEDIAQQEKDLRNERQHIIDMLRSDGYNLRMIMDQAGVSEGPLGIETTEAPGSNLKLLRSQEFENNLMLFLLTSIQTGSSHYRPLMEEINGILAALDKNIGDHR